MLSMYYVNIIDTNVYITDMYGLKRMCNTIYDMILYIYIYF